MALQNNVGAVNSVAVANTGGLGLAFNPGASGGSSAHSHTHTGSGCCGDSGAAVKSMLSNLSADRGNFSGESCVTIDLFGEHIGTCLW